MDNYIIHGKREQLAIIFAISLSVFMFSLDYSMVNISLPIIAQYFKVRLITISWLPILYILMVTGSLLSFGKLGDLKGYKKLFILGVAIFLFGSLLCSTASNIYFLGSFRMFQSVGEAMMAPMGIAIITTFLPLAKRGTALGLVALAQGLGLSLGNLLGGFVDAHFIWRGIFFINIPIGLFIILFSLKKLPTKQRKITDTRFDIPGAIFIFLSLASAIYVINSISSKVEDSFWLILALSILSIVTFAMFIRQETKEPHPLLGLGLFKNLDFSMANIAAFLIIAIMMGFIFIAPFYFEKVKGLKIMEASNLITIASIAMFLAAPLAGKLSDKWGARPLCVFGSCLSIVSLAIFSFTAKESSLWHTGIALVLLGISAGFFLAPNNKLVMAQAPIDKQGVASGIYKICISIGSVLGIALLPFFIMRTISAISLEKNIPIPETVKYPEIMESGFKSAFIFALAIAFAALIFSLLAKDKKENA